MCLRAGRNLLIHAIYGESHKIFRNEGFAQLVIFGKSLELTLAESSRNNLTEFSN